MKYLFLLFLLLSNLFSKTYSAGSILWRGDYPSCASSLIDSGTIDSGDCVESDVDRILSVGHNEYLVYSSYEPSNSTCEYQIFSVVTETLSYYKEIEGDYCKIEHISYTNSDGEDIEYDAFGDLVCDDGTEPILTEDGYKCQECNPPLNDGYVQIDNSICEAGEFDTSVYSAITSIPHDSCDVCIGTLLDDGDDSNNDGDDSTADDGGSTADDGGGSTADDGGDDLNNNGDDKDDKMIVQPDVCSDSAPKYFTSKDDNIGTCDRSCEQVGYVTMIDGSCFKPNCVDTSNLSNEYVVVDVAMCVHGFDSTKYSEVRIYNSEGCEDVCVAKLLSSVNDVSDENRIIINPNENYLANDGEKLKEAPLPSEGSGGNSLTDEMKNLGESVNLNSDELKSNTEALKEETNATLNNIDSLNSNTDSLSTVTESLNNLDNTLNNTDSNEESLFDTSSFSDFVSNSASSVTSLKTQLDDSLLILEKGFNTNVVAGSTTCPFTIGTSSHQSSFDICSLLSPFSSLFAMIITIGMLAYSIRIMFWGLK